MTDISDADDATSPERRLPAAADDLLLAPIPSARQVRILLGSLTTIVGLIVALNLTPLMRSWVLDRLFGLNGEISVPSWLSSAILLAIAAGAAALALYESALRHERKLVFGWWAVAALFVALSADETAMLHEMVGLVTSERLFQVESLPGMFVWVLVLAPVGFAIAVVLFRWLRATMGWKTRYGRMGLAALAVWAAVPAMELLDPWMGAPNWLHVLEESLEFAGEILMLGCILGYLRELQRRHPLARVLAGREDRETSGAESAEATGRRVA